jgi:maltose alpha-D-glucosyltransferase / alpha-amylase
VRTPMQWNADRNAGFSRANPQQLFLPVIVDPQYHYETVNVETQQLNPHSLLWWTKRIIALRKRYAAFGRGSIELLQPDNPSILAFVRRYQDQIILIVCNLSRFVQYTDLDLAEFKDSTPVELFSARAFPAISDRPYFFMLGPHGFYSFALQPLHELETTPEVAEELAHATLNVTGAWTNILNKADQEQLEAVLPAYLRERRWFQSKAKQIRVVKIRESIAIPNTDAHLVLLSVSYRAEDDETYLLPVSFVTGDNIEQVRQRLPNAIISELIVEADNQLISGVIFDALGEPTVCSALVQMIYEKRRLKGSTGTVIAEALPALKDLWDEEALQQPTVLGYEQSNTSVRFDERMIFKLVRKVAEGVNPELEIGRFLSTKSVNTPPLLGSLEFKPGKGELMTLGVLQAYVPNQGDAWRYTLGWLARYLDDALVRSTDELHNLPSHLNNSFMQLVQQAIPDEVEELFGGYLADAHKLGHRTGEMHVALASDSTNEDFKPEPFSKLYQRSLYQSMRDLTNRVFVQLRSKRRSAPDDLVPLIDQTLSKETQILNAFQGIADKRLSGMRIRVHGDYHLGQVLYSEGDFMIIDFEGEPGRTLSDRRLKRSPLRDVAGMLRSFHYAAYAALPGYGVQQSIAREEDFPVLEPWARLWQTWTSVAFLKAYLDTVDSAKILPRDPDELEMLLHLFLLEKAVYEVGYELNNRPEWLKVPIQAIVQQFEEAKA